MVNIIMSTQGIIEAEINSFKWDTHLAILRWRVPNNILISLLSVFLSVCRLCVKKIIKQSANLNLSRKIDKSFLSFEHYGVFTRNAE